MSPPLPPSPSYLLVLESSSEEENSNDDDEEKDQRSTNNPSEQQQQEVSDEPTTATTQTLLVSDEDNEDEAAVLLPESKKKKKKRKKKKKKHHNETNHTRKQVQFGDVSVREHARCLGTDVVPLDGGWPLGISNHIVKDRPSFLTVDDFEQRRETELRERWQKQQQQQQVQSTPNNNNNKHNSPASTANSESPPPPIPLETRQYDYKKKIKGQADSGKNPLFSVLKEDARRKLLLWESSSSNDDVTMTVTPTKALKSPSSPSKHHHHHYNTRSSGRSRSLSNASDPAHYNDAYTSTDVKHVQHELEQVRNQRSLEHQGCSCRKHDVTKHKHRKKMTERKVKEELRKRGLLPKTTTSPSSKSELEQLLWDAMAKEPCCWGEDCSCVKNGIPCSADTCLCWHTSHQGSKHQQGSSSTSKPSSSPIESATTTTREIQERCGNRYGMTVVDFSTIDAHRQQYYCQPVINHQKE